MYLETTWRPSVFHTRISLPAAVARYLPFGDQASSLTGPLWPSWLKVGSFAQPSLAMIPMSFVRRGTAKKLPLGCHETYAEACELHVSAVA